MSHLLSPVHCSAVLNATIVFAFHAFSVNTCCLSFFLKLVIILVHKNYCCLKFQQCSLSFGNYTQSFLILGAKLFGRMVQEEDSNTSVPTAFQITRFRLTAISFSSQARSCCALTVFKYLSVFPNYTATAKLGVSLIIFLSSEILYF